MQSRVVRWESFLRSVLSPCFGDNATADKDGRGTGPTAEPLKGSQVPVRFRQLLSKQLTLLVDCTSISIVETVIIIEATSFLFSQRRGLVNRKMPKQRIE